MSLPHFPRVGDTWEECFICGEEHPTGEMVPHYKKERLVCSGCDDEPGHSDYYEYLILPAEEEKRTIQPVTGQGQAEDLYEDQDTSGGAGLGGSGSGNPR